MNVFLCQFSTCLFIVLTNIVVMTTSADQPSGNEYPINYFSGEFENFLHGLGSMVYKYKKPARPTQDTHYFIHEYPDSTPTEQTKIYRRNEKLLKTQKEVLKDVLMMKLVSYYEDKYKVTHSDIQDLMSTTSSSLQMLTDNMQRYFAKSPRSESLTYVNTSPQTTERLRKTLTTVNQLPNDSIEVEVL